MDPRVDGLLRDLTPQVLGAVVRRFRDFAASEDAVQEALIAAAAQWPRDGVPDNPRGWLIHVALRRMTDYVRSEVSRRDRADAARSRRPNDYRDREIISRTRVDNRAAYQPGETEYQSLARAVSHA